MVIEPETMASWVTLAFIAGNIAALAAWAGVTHRLRGRRRRASRMKRSVRDLERTPDLSA